MSPVGRYVSLMLQWSIILSFSQESAVKVKISYTTNDIPDAATIVPNRAKQYAGI